MGDYTDILARNQPGKATKTFGIVLGGIGSPNSVSSHQDQALFVPAGDGFSARGRAQLGEDGADVEFHGVF